MSDPTNSADKLQAAIAALLSQRGTLGDAVVDQAVAALRAQQALHGARQAEQQLKQVTVLFTDVVGSTSLSQHLDPEDINAVMDGALERFTACVQAERGRVLQYAGDSVLAVFGSPVAHEDDAEHAVRAGLAILGEGRALGQQIQARYGQHGFNVRVGIHSGGVLLGGGVDGEHTIRGIAVNIAARMEQTAPPGALRISHDTYRLVRGRFELQRQPPLLVKGADEPIVTYLVSGVRAEPDWQATRGVEGVSTRMVGRDDEMAQLQKAYLASAAARPAVPAVVTVVGEAGLGKSRLASEFRGWAEAQPRGACWLHAHAGEQHMSRPYAMLRNLLASRSDLLDSDPPALAREKWLATAAPLLANRGDAAVLGHLLGLDFSADEELRSLRHEARQLRDRAFFHAAQWLRALAASGHPVVALLDDLHWTDDGTLDFIDYLFAADQAPPLLLIGLTRPTLYERRPGWGGTHPHSRRIDLAPLSAAQATELVDGLLSRLQRLPAALRELIAANAEGNPFYIEELVNMLLDQGVIAVDGDAWQLRSERLPSLQVPHTLVGVLQARLDALPVDEHRTLQLAAVVGHEFWDASLLALGAPLPGTLQGLIDREFALLHEPSRLQGMHEYAFKHHTLHKVAYDSVLKRLKRNLHAQVAHWLVGLPGAPPLDLVAEHFERGGEAATALDYWQRAAEAAAARYANAQALAHAEHALGLTPADDLARRYALTLLRCRVLELTTEREQLAQQLDALQALAEQAADAARQSEALVRRARYHYDDGDTLRALESARQAVERAPADDPASGAWAHALLAQCLARLGRGSDAEQESTAALDFARAAGNKAIEGMILNDMAMRVDERGDHAAAIDLYERALALHREVGNRTNEAGTLSNLGYAALMLGKYDAARTQFELARALFARVGHRQNEGITLVNLGIAMLNQGQPAQALAQARQALEILRAAGYRWAEGAALRLIGQAALACGNCAAAVEHFQASRDLFEALGMAHLALEPMAGLAGAALTQHDLGAALAQVEEILRRQASGVSLDGAEEPMRVQLICHQVLREAGDPRAQEVLATAYQALQARAGRIGDVSQRQTYLREVPYHRELIAAWRGSAGGGAAS